MKMKTAVLVFAFLASQVFSEECKEGTIKKLDKGLYMRCDKGAWKPVEKQRSALKSKPCEDNAAYGTCPADRGHCMQYTKKGVEMDRDCPGTCNSCDGCHCQDDAQWHKYCPYWAQYCDSPGVLGTWMTTNCRKSCGKCKCGCCSYKGKKHPLGAKIFLPEKCSYLECQESLVAESSLLLPGAVHHNVSHPEELTLVLVPVHDGSECCVLSQDATSQNGTVINNGTMVEEGWIGLVQLGDGSVQATCCHGSLCVAFKDVAQGKLTRTTTTTTPKINTPKSLRCPSGWALYNGTKCLRLFTTERSWNDAEDFCQKESNYGFSGHLASIHSPEEQDFIKNLNVHIVFIGANEIEKQGQWKWSDDSTWNYEFWKGDEGYHQNAGEDCAVFLSSGWHDYPCSARVKFVCQLT